MTKWLKDVWAKTWVNVGTKVIVGLWAAFWAADVAAGGRLSDAVGAYSRAPIAEQDIAPHPATNAELWEALLSHEHHLEQDPVGMDTDLEAMLEEWRDRRDCLANPPCVVPTRAPATAPKVTVRPSIEIHPPTVPLEVQIDFPTPVEPPQAPAAPPEIRWPGWLR